VAGHQPRHKAGGQVLEHVALHLRAKQHKACTGRGQGGAGVAGWGASGGLQDAEREAARIGAQQGVVPRQASPSLDL
jgi:hypothetical protein